MSLGPGKPSFQLLIFFHLNLIKLCFRPLHHLWAEKDIKGCPRQRFGCPQGVELGCLSLKTKILLNVIREWPEIHKDKAV